MKFRLLFALLAFLFVASISVMPEQASAQTTVFSISPGDGLTTSGGLFAPALTPVYTTPPTYSDDDKDYDPLEEFVGGLKADASTEIERDKSRAGNRQITRILSGQIDRKMGIGPGRGPGDRPEEIAYSLDGAPQTGLSAGDGMATRFGLWQDTSVSIISGTESFRGYDGALLNVMAGFDYSFSDRFIVGLGLGWEYSGMGTDINGHQEHNGFTLAPYAAVDLYRNTLLEAMGAFTWSAVNQGSGPDYGSFRSMFGLQLAQHYLVNNWHLMANIGWSYSYTDAWQNRVNDVQIGELAFGGKVGYTFERVEPYLQVRYVVDTLAARDSDPDDFEGTFGLDILLTEQLFLNLEATNMFFRDHEYNTRLLGHLRYEF